MRESVKAIASELPAPLARDLISYTQSVEDSLSDIFRDAGVSRTDILSEQVIFIAAIKKLNSIVSSHYRILDNALRALSNDVSEVRLGSLVVSRRSRYFRQVQDLHQELRQFLIDQDLEELVHTSSYAEIVRRLIDER